MQIQTAIVDCCGMTGLAAIGHYQDEKAFKEAILKNSSLIVNRRGAGVQAYIEGTQPAMSYLEKLGWVKTYVGKNTNYMNHDIYSFFTPLQDLKDNIAKWKAEKAEAKANKANKNNVFDVEED